MYIRMKFIIVVVLCLFPFLQSSAQLRQNLLLDQEWEFRSDKDGNNLTWESNSPAYLECNRWPDSRLLSGNGRIPLSSEHIAGDVKTTCFPTF